VPLGLPDFSVPRTAETERRNEMTQTQALSPTAEQALSRVLALRKLTFENQTVTRRAQNVILQSLSHEDMIAVAEELMKHQQ
jgi:hypothetical protein